MMQKLKEFIEARGATMESYLSYDYGLGKGKTHSYFKLETSMPFKKTTVFIAELAIGSSPIEFFNKLSIHLQNLKNS
jgi:hypothetical protein